MSAIQKFLDDVNSKYVKLHKNYESLFWTLYMGDKSVGLKKDKALAALDEFRSSESLCLEALALQEKSDPKLKYRLQTWVDFLSLYQMPSEAKDIKNEIATLETVIQNKRSSLIEGYIDPDTKKFVSASTSVRAKDQERVWGAISGMVSSLGDPYTVFLPPAEKKTFDEDISGNFEGVGMEVGIKDDVLTVIAPAFFSAK